MRHCLALVRLTHCLSVHCRAEVNGYRSVSVSMLSLTASAVRRAVKGQSMGKRDNKVLSLVGVDLADADNSQLKDYFASTLKRGMHGIGFSAYEEVQKPGDDISLAQIKRRMTIIKPHFEWVRSFSCRQGNELIPMVAKQMGLKTLVGAWLGESPEKNADDIARLIQLAQDGYVDIAVVGNEVMYRGDLTEDELLTHIYQVKAALPNIPVGYVDAYYEFEDRPAITAACDVILANCYPFWEGCALEYSLLYMKDMYRRTVKVAAGKDVIITETGWPNKGQDFYGAKPSQEATVRYFINAQQWAHEEGIDMFYFSSFDEPWKVGAEGDVGAYWGLWDKDESLKYL